MEKSDWARMRMFDGIKAVPRYICTCGHRAYDHSATLSLCLRSKCLCEEFQLPIREQALQALLEEP